MFFLVSFISEKLINLGYLKNDEVNFKIYKYNNGEENPFWDKIDNIQVILVEGKGYFEIAAHEKVRCIQATEASTWPIV